MDNNSVTIATVLAAMKTVVDTFWTMFTGVIQTINDNPLLKVPVLFALAFALITFAISVIRRLGVRGVSSAGGRRRRARR